MIPFKVGDLVKVVGKVGDTVGRINFIEVMKKHEGRIYTIKKVQRLFGVYVYQLHSGDSFMYVEDWLVPHCVTNQDEFIAEV